MNKYMCSSCRSTNVNKIKGYNVTTMKPTWVRASCQDCGKWWDEYGESTLNEGVQLDGKTE